MIETNGKGRFRIEGRGPWISERVVSCRLANGGYVLTHGGRIIGAWMQETCGHYVIAVA